MKTYQMHSWQVSIDEAKQIQHSLARRVLHNDKAISPHLIAGADISAPDSSGMARAAAIVLSYPDMEVVEAKTVQDKLSFPYIPGLLSFREMPLVLAAFEMLSTDPDLIMVDGQGIAHPRRFGIASHLGLLLDKPAVGCAKSRLCGRHQAPADEPGAYSQLIDNGEIIGAVVRTRAKVAPIYVSVGHKMSLSQAVHWVTQCCRGYRIPEPTRLAHLVAGGKLPMPTRTSNRSTKRRLFA